MDLKIFLIFVLYNNCDCVLQLKKVISFSRHSLRAPLFEDFQSLSPKKWPNWDVKPGHMTAKGALIEHNMGEYFSTWLLQEQLFQSNCPRNECVLIYANYLNRTIGTAKKFAESAFPNCSVPVSFVSRYVNYTIFPFLIRNMTEEAVESASNEMQKKLDELDLKDTYDTLNNVSEIRNSVICRRDGYCDLSHGKDVAFFKNGDYPHITGRFEIGKALADTLLMSFYEGFSFEESGWSHMEDHEWRTIIKIINEDLKIEYELNVTRQYMKPLFKYLKTVSEDEKKFTLIVGHDTNLFPLMHYLGLRSYMLVDQFEWIPIGSKLVLQKWSDGVNDFLKAEYVYHSWNQVRNGEKFTPSNIPKKITLHFNSFKADKNGMYPWSLFQNILNDLIN